MINQLILDIYLQLTINPVNTILYVPAKRF